MTPASSGVDPSLHALKVAYITDHTACAEGVLKIPYYKMAEPACPIQRVLCYIHTFCYTGYVRDTALLCM